MFIDGDWSRTQVSNRYPKCKAKLHDLLLINISSCLYRSKTWQAYVQRYYSINKNVDFLYSACARRVSLNDVFILTDFFSILLAFDRCRLLVLYSIFFCFEIVIYIVWFFFYLQVTHLKINHNPFAKGFRDQTGNGKRDKK